MSCVQEAAPADFGSGGIEDQRRQISMLQTVTVPKRRKLHLLVGAVRFWCRLYSFLLHCSRGRLLNSRPADILDVGLTVDVYSSIVT